MVQTVPVLATHWPVLVSHFWQPVHPAQTQRPPLHTPLAHWWPHAPQFWGSEFTSAPPRHPDQADQLPSLHVRVAVPVHLQICEVAPTHEQLPHWQLPPQV
jgi:hypothetical protein